MRKRPKLISTWVIMCAILGSTVRVEQESADDSIFDNQAMATVLACIDNLAAECEQLDSEFEVIGPVLVEMPQISETWPTGRREDQEERQMAAVPERRFFQWRHRDGLTKMVRFVDEDALRAGTPSAIWVWNGEQLFTQLTSGTEPDQIRIDPTIRRPIDGMPMLDIWHGCVEYRSISSPGRLGDVIRTGDILNSTIEGDNALIRVKIPSTHNALEIEVACIQQIDRWCIKSVILDYFAPSGKHLQRYDLQIDDWQSIGDVNVPARAYLWASKFEMRARMEMGLPPVASYFEYVRRSGTHPPEEPRDQESDQLLFNIGEPSVGTWIFDTTLNISYTIGDSHLIIDGKRKPTSRPIDAIIIDELPELLRDGDEI